MQIFHPKLNNNFATDTRVATDNAYHETCMGTYGGCVVRNLTLMNATNKASLVKFIKSWKTSGSNSATEFNVKSGGDRTANSMQEAWAYYNGKVGMSGKNYATSIVGAGCQKNFVIYIGNSFNNSGGPADGGSESPYSGTNALTSAQVGATAAQKIKIAETVTFNPSTCGVTSIAASTTASNWSENWADEWARVMYQQDAGQSGNEGVQNITTYTIGVVNDAACKADYPALLTTMAKYGGGKYFKTSTAADVKLALGTILNEVQAVNSVFSSASLPVSVNAEGSYLNQIYLGMFRPDPTASPRWMGNLKQYQLVKNSTGALVMGDALGIPSISSAGTGFISPNAVSFWTKKDTTKAPDTAAIGGFWVNDKKGVPESGYDLPDGEVVEKGGVSQQLRLEALTADFAATAGSTSNPRRMYTYCPTGADCVAALTDTANQFSTANATIPTLAFGSSSTIPVQSIVRTGTNALVTTTGAHGFSTGTTVTISNAGQNDYNVTQAITVNSANTFTITGLTDYPNATSTVAYSITRPGGTPTAISSIVRNTSTTGSANSETVTVTTTAAHSLVAGSTVTIAGVTPSDYNGNKLIATASGNTLTFTAPVYPTTPKVNGYTAVHAPYSRTISTAQTVTVSGNKVVTVVTSTAHGFHVGQTVTVSGTGETKYDGTQIITAVQSVSPFTSFQFTTTGSPANKTIGAVAPSSTKQALTSLTRTGTTVSATATASVSGSNWFANGDVVNIAQASGTAANESAYIVSNATIKCTSPCTSFTYTIATTPSTPVGAGGTVSLYGGSDTALAGDITRVGTTATLKNIPSGTFVNGDIVNISALDTPLDSESGYVGTWTLSCTAPCTQATFGPVTLTPATPATGTNIQAFAAGTAPDRDSLIKWLRGADNYGDEKGPGGTVTIRPSIHGDVLHSRPLVINYGDSRGIVVFYGSNDGVYRAVNGNQTAAMGSIPAGGEMWGLILPEHYSEINRLRLNSPELKFPSTTVTTALPKNYFVDGATGAYQKLKADGTIDKAIIYLTMRRGGRFMYAVDVTTPTNPTVLWRIDTTVTGFEELGQTWSRPRVTLLQSSPLQSTPVIVFGGGYDGAEDSEPPATGTMGRGIYVVNAETGALIWSATPTCTTSDTCLNVPGMTYAIPSDIAFVDRDVNGYTDKFYFGDMGGNIWRADVAAAATASWKVSKLAALGCNTGTCASGTTPRKFFFPPSVLTIKASGASGSFDAVSLASGDREHPLKSTATGSSYNVNDRFFMIMDTGTQVGVTATVNVTPAADKLVNATSTEYDGTLNGFYINFATGEKGVNAPLAVNGLVFFATNRPTDPSSSCAANLGEAKAYAVSPFLATTNSNILAGGGLAPSPVSGLISITNPDGSTSEEKFCIGCAMDCTGSSCSALENSPPPVAIPKNMRRTYWYRK